MGFTDKRIMALMITDQQIMKAKLMLRLHKELQSADRIFVFSSADNHHTDTYSRGHFG